MTKFLCDYCGGFEVSDEEYAKVFGTELVISKIIGLQFDVKAIGGRPAIKQNYCFWCWDKAIRAALSYHNQIPH